MLTESEVKIAAESREESYRSLDAILKDAYERSKQTDNRRRSTPTVLGKMKEK